MKIVVLGKGRRIIELVRALGSCKRFGGKNLQVIVDDRYSYESLHTLKIPVRLEDLSRFGEGKPLKIGDGKAIWLVALDEVELIQGILQRFPHARGLVLTSPEGIRSIGTSFPNWEFLNDQEVYAQQIRYTIDKLIVHRKINSLIEVVGETRKIIVIIYGNPDPDAIASAYALKVFLGREGNSFLITYTGELARPENVAMIKTVGIPIQRFDEGVLNTNPILATLDAQPPFFSRGESGLSGKDLHFDIVIDHHPRTKFGKVRFSDIRPSYGSTSTILSEYFLYYKKRIPRRVATALLYGLKADTNNLQREVNTADVLAFNRLRTYADENLVRKIELSQFPQVTLDHFQTALVKKKILGDVLFVYLGYIDDPDTCVYIADFYIRVSGISWAIVSSISKEKLIVVFRSDGFKKDAGKAAAIAFGEFGSAGGHRVMARAEVDLLRLLAEIHSHSEHYIEQWIIQRLSLCFPRFGGLT